jgi:hypothetical protein
VQDNSSFLFNYGAGGVSIENWRRRNRHHELRSADRERGRFGSKLLPASLDPSDVIGVAQDLQINSAGSVDFLAENNGLVRAGNVSLIVADPVMA